MGDGVGIGRGGQVCKTWRGEPGTREATDRGSSGEAGSAAG